MAEELEAGLAYIQLMASGRGLQGDVDKQVKKVKAPDIAVKLDAQIGDLEGKVAQAKAKIETIRTAAADPQIGLDITALEAKAAVVRSKLDELRRKDATPRVSADIAQAEAQLGRLTSKMAALETKRSTVHVEAETARAQANVDALESKLSRLRGQRASIQLDVDGAAAAGAQLDAVDGKRRSLNGSNATVSVAAAGGAQASGMLGAIVAGLAAVSSLAPAAGAALAGALAAASAGAQGLGAVKAGFSGIGDAIKAVQSDEKSAATSSASSAASRTSSASQIASAQAGVTQAVTQASRTSITGAQQVADAELARSRAVVSAGRAQITGAQQVADAELARSRAVVSAGRAQITAGWQVASAARSVADAQTSAAARVASAERSLENAQRSRQYAQEALTRATQEATRANRDLQMSVAGAGLAEERATLALAQARARLAKGSSDPLEQADLSLSVREAEQNLREVQTRYGDLKGEQAEWARTGVAGSRQVVDATRSLQDAQRGVGDASRSLNEAQVEGVRSVANAQLAAGQAVIQAGWQQADAANSVRDANVAAGRAAQQAGWQQADAAAAVRDANTAVGRAAQQAGWQQEDAARGVEAAQLALGQAYGTTGAGVAAAGKQSAYALSKLSQGGREFVAFWTGVYKPAIDGVTKATADEMLPRVQASLNRTLGVLPLFRDGLAQTGAVIGDLTIKGSDLATSPAFRASFGTIMASNNRSLQLWGDAALSGVDATRALTVSGLPLSERMATVAQRAMQSVDSFILQKEATGELGQFMAMAGDKVGNLVSVAGDLVGMGYQLVVALAPVGDVVLGIVSAGAQFAGEFIRDHQALVQFLATAGIAVATLNGLAKATVAVQASAAIAGGGLKTLWSVTSTLLNPSALEGSRAMQALAASGATAGGALGSATGKITGSSTAMATGAAAGARLTGVLSTALSVAPLLGVAFVGAALGYDALTTSSIEASAALLKGGSAAAQMRSELAQNDAKQREYQASMGSTMAGIREWATGMLGTETTTKQATVALEEQIATMTPLEAAQARATLAQTAFDSAVKEFGATSPQAVSALQNLQARSRDVEIAQLAVREKTDLATAAMLYQRDQILASLDADLRKRMAVQQLAKDQQGYADAIRTHGPASQEAQTAGLQLEQTQLRVAEAAKASAGGQRAYAQSIGDLVTKTNGELTPTLAGMVQSLDWAGLSAAGAQVKINAAGQSVATFPNGKTVVLDANTSLAVQQINFTRDLVNGTRGTIGVDADPGPGVAKVGAFKLQTDATTGVVTINGNISPADQQRLGIQAKTDGTTGTMWIDGNPVPCDGKLNGARVSVDRTTGVMSIDANTRPADDASRRVHDGASQPVGFDVHANTQPAEGAMSRFWGSVKAEFSRWWSNPFSITPGGHATGGLITGYARGGVTGNRLRGYARGSGGSSTIASSDTVPAMLTPGEFVIRKRAVDRIGLPALEAINGMAVGGEVLGFAAGGSARKPSQATMPAAAPVAAPVAAPAAAVAGPAPDAAGAAGAAGATSALASSMAAAQSQATSLNPALAALAATQAGLLAPSTAAVTAGQQAMVTTGIVPLVTAMVGSLFPTLGVYQQQVGLAAPAANTALQAAQLGTRLSTSATALNTAINSTAMGTAMSAMSLTGQVQHAGLRAGQFATQLSTSQTALNTALNSQNMTTSMTSMSMLGQYQHALLRAGQVATQMSNAVTATNTAQHNANMAATTGGMSATVQNHLAGVRGAQGVTAQATTAFADAWRAQLGRTMPDSGNPLRWVINYPIRSTVDAWNTLDAQFALGKHVNPPVPNFATGGDVNGPGTGTSDSIVARLSDGEFVVREKVASAVPHFLQALNRGQPEAIQAAGGRHARMPGYAAGGVVAAQQFAQAQNGKPYIWGGVGPAGYDCSGFMSAITNVLRGQAPHRRLGVAASVPWGGFARGLNGAFAMGASSGHTAGTLGGVNVEAGGSPHRTKYGAGAVGADSGQFPVKAFLPQIGGQFVSGGAGGGGGFFDPTPLVDAAFAKAFREVADIPKLFGPSPQVGRDQGVAKAGAEGGRAKMLEKLIAMFAASGLGPLGAGAPFYVQQISNAARVRGLGIDGATIGVATAIVETGLRNLANRAVPASLRLPNDGLGGDHDSVGLFQQRQAGWGTVEQRMNPFAAAGMFFNRLQSFNWRAMAPGAAAQRVQVSAFPGRYAGEMGRARQLVATHGGAFDNGGPLLPGLTMAYNGTGAPERILDNVETRNYDTLGRLMGRGGMKVDMADTSPASGPGIEIHVHPRANHDEGDIATAVERRLDFAMMT